MFLCGSVIGDKMESSQSYRIAPIQGKTQREKCI